MSSLSSVLLAGSRFGGLPVGFGVRSAQSAAPVQFGSEATAPKKVLILEDDEIISPLLEEYLETLGFTPLLAKTIEQAQTILKQHPDLHAAMIDQDGYAGVNGHQWAID